jgi:hypothetical protein
MADLLLASPALAKKLWQSMASPNTRRVARKLSQSGLSISHENRGQLSACSCTVSNFEQIAVQLNDILASR